MSSLSCQEVSDAINLGGLKAENAPWELAHTHTWALAVKWHNRLLKN